MKKDIEELIVKRCELALMENKEYMKKEMNESVSPDELQALAEKLCYKKGFFDALFLILCSQSV